MVWNDFYTFVPSQSSLYYFIIGKTLITAPCVLTVITYKIPIIEKDLKYSCRVKLILLSYCSLILKSLVLFCFVFTYLDKYLLILNFQEELCFYKEVLCFHFYNEMTPFLFCQIYVTPFI